MNRKTLYDPFAAMELLRSMSSTFQLRVRFFGWADTGNRMDKHSVKSKENEKFEIKRDVPIPVIFRDKL